MALAAVVAAFPAFSQVTAGQTVLVEEPWIALPQGDELSDTELLAVDGEADPLTIVATGIVSGAISAVLDVAKQLGTEGKVDGKEVAMAFGAGFVGGVIGSTAAGAKAVAVVRSGLAGALRWTGRAVATVGGAAVSFGQRVYETLHRVYIVLHTHVSERVVNAFRTVWDWLRR